jgi:hypothetical protein
MKITIVFQQTHKYTFQYKPAASHGGRGGKKAGQNTLFSARLPNLGKSTHEEDHEGAKNDRHGQNGIDQSLTE